MNRLLLSEKLHELCDHVYYQPPPNVHLEYPCIIYERRTGDTVYADNLPYRFTYSYTLTYIDPDPDSVVPLKIASLPMCKMDRCYTVDNLNHTIFVLYFFVAPSEKIYSVNDFTPPLRPNPPVNVEASDLSVFKIDDVIYLKGALVGYRTYDGGTTLLFSGSPEDTIPGDVRLIPCVLRSSYSNRSCSYEKLIVDLGRIYLLNSAAGGVYNVIDIDDSYKL